METKTGKRGRHDYLDCMIRKRTVKIEIFEHCIATESVLGEERHWMDGCILRLASAVCSHPRKGRNRHIILLLTTSLVTAPFTADLEVSRRSADVCTATLPYIPPLCINSSAMSQIIEASNYRRSNRGAKPQTAPDDSQASTSRSQAGALSTGAPKRSEEHKHYISPIAVNLAKFKHLVDVDR